MRGSVLPEPVEPIRREVGIACRVRNVLVAEIVLYRSRIVAIVRELVAASMAQHVRVNGEGKRCLTAGSSDHLAHCRRGERPFALGHKNVGRRSIVALNWSAGGTLEGMS